MAKLLEGRWTHDHQEDICIFLIGMRANKWWHVRTWWPSFIAFPRMLRELRQDPARGFLGGSLQLGTNGVLTVQYWRSVDDLYHYASDRSGNHPATWKAFFDRDGKDPGSTGIWHETYVIPAGGTESVYDNMPLMGLAEATKAVRVTPRSNTARQRLAGER